MPDATSELRDVVRAMSSAVFCCECLARVTGLSALAVRRSVLAVSRTTRLVTWKTCRACGAPEETYGIP